MTCDRDCFNCIFDDCILNDADAARHMKEDFDPDYEEKKRLDSNARRRELYAKSPERRKKAQENCRKYRAAHPDYMKEWKRKKALEKKAKETV